MNRVVKVGLVQQANTDNVEENINKLEKNIKELALKGCNLIVLQELHNTLYFCQHEDTSYFDLAESIPGKSTEIFSRISDNNKVVLVTSLLRKSTRYLSQYSSGI